MRPWKRPKLFYSKYLLILFSVSHGVVANEVRVYNWSDYIAQAVIEEFEDETGIEVIYDVGRMLAVALVSNKSLMFLQLFCILRLEYCFGTICNC